MDRIWEEIHSRNEWGAYPSEHVIRFFARNYYGRVRNGEQIKVLDFGCGGGAHTWYLAREGFCVYAFDGSEHAVRNTENRLKRENLQASFKVADGTDVQYERDFFDAVLDNVCIYANRLEDIRSMYHKIYGFLKPGGKLLTVCFGRNTCGFGQGTEIEENTFTDIKKGPLTERGVTHFFDEADIGKVISEAGFRNLQTDRILYTDRGDQVEQFVTQAEK
jgi:2-polyprenyl-3-methyl-5-hydroxy-6-metoxy-1,4-benzoquinol methylase